MKAVTTSHVLRQTRHFDWLSNELGIKTQDDWYRVSSQKLKKIGGRTLADEFKGSIKSGLQTVYPQFIWKQWLFDTCPLFWWKHKSNQKEYLEWLKDELCIQNKGDWFQVSIGDVLKLKGNRLLSHYESSLLTTLQDVHPLLCMEESECASSNFVKRKALSLLGQQLGVNKLEDWYKIKQDRLVNVKSVLLQENNGDLVKTLYDVMPEYPWQFWMFSCDVPSSMYTPQNQRNYCDWLSKRLGLKVQEDWYSVSREVISRHKGIKLLQLHHYSMSQLLKSAYPEFIWDTEAFVRRLPSPSVQQQNHRQFCDSLAEELSIESADGWYKVTADVVKEYGGSSILQAYGGSVSNMIRSLYPEYQLVGWMFVHEVKNPGSSHTFTLDWIEKSFNVKTTDDWYNITKEMIKRKGGTSLVQLGYSMIATLQNAYPQYEWHPWLFKKVPQNFWEEKQIQRKFFDWTAEELCIEQQSGWYRVRCEEVGNKGGAGLLRNYYNGSLLAALESIYPEFEWHPFFFEHAPRHTWSKIEFQRQYMEWLRGQLGIESITGWHSITLNEVRDNGGNSLLAQYGGSLYQALLSIYPEYEWPKAWSVSEGQLATIKLLQKLVKTEIKVNHKMYIPNIRAKIELDIYLPTYNFAIEYQGKQHYVSGPIESETLDERQRKDDVKKRMCEHLGISVLHVPYWWDSSSASTLIASLKRIRPDIPLDLTQIDYPASTTVTTPI